MKKYENAKAKYNNQNATQTKAKAFMEAAKKTLNWRPVLKKIMFIISEEEAYISIQALL